MAIYAAGDFQNLLVLFRYRSWCIGSYLWIIVAFAFMFPNAELALMFIPV
jgi:hypothetical protein